MRARRIKRPSGVLFIAGWALSVFVLVTVGFWVQPWFFPDADSVIGRDPFLISCVAPVLGLLCATYAAAAGAIHALLRGILRSAAEQSVASASPFFIGYRLINLGYGLAVGLVFGSFGLCATAVPTELATLVGASMIVCGVCGVIVGEVALPQFEKGEILLPIQPFPVRKLSAEEDELLDDADEVLRRLQSPEVKRRVATFFARANCRTGSTYLACSPNSGCP